MVTTPLDFVGDAISLSGLTGTKLKCDVIGKYYPFWWNITSGGQRHAHRFHTAIVELNAATGEVYIKDTQETVLGSAGHALELKVNAPQTQNLKVILIEDNRDCYMHLKRVIKRRWPTIPIDEAENLVLKNSCNVYLLNMSLDDALKRIEQIKLGNTLFFFDPLRSVEYATIDKVARQRIRRFYKTGTELIIFIFTSDWFLGRDDFAPLPRTIEESSWSKDERATVTEADDLFGNREWRSRILNENPVQDRERVLIELYKNRLHKWFRYILPLPFEPKKDQIFHLILCSNYETGVRATRNFYSNKTGNPKYSPDNAKAFRRFRQLHPEIFRDVRGARRPLHWRILWVIITQHEEGICDCMCQDLINIRDNPENVQLSLEWLEKEGYLIKLKFENAWDSSIKQYMLNWKILKERLGVGPPSPLRPLSTEEIKDERGYQTN